MPGIDEIFSGGIPKRSIALIAGGLGIGKSIMGMQYLWNGLQISELGVYVALGECSVQVRINVKQFN
ncbi:MAG: ATPase domain-containing protein [Desulfurococcaceae archaeon]|nr:ATPase domain-containing protein [Desulfurococcaceae archaeon]